MSDQTTDQLLVQILKIVSEEEAGLRPSALVARVSTDSIDKDKVAAAVRRGIDTHALMLGPQMRIVAAREHAA